MKHWKATVATAIFCGWAQICLADPSGTYAVTGTSPGGGTYAGQVTVERTGDVLDLVWTISRDTFTGLGVVSGDTLSIAYESATSVSGVAQLGRTEDGWHGVWAYYGEPEIGTETWTAVATSGGASAGASQSSGSLSSLSSLSEQYLSADGYELKDVDALNAAIEEQLKSLNGESVFRPGAELGPFVKAVLALEAMDGIVERARYRIRYGLEMVQMPPAADPVPVSFVQIDRFNLGPAIREELVAVHGEANVAPPAVFGEGRHASWRLITRPLMGTAADIAAAARTEIDDDAAEVTICLGTACLSTASAVEGAAPWSEMKTTDHGQDAPYRTERDGLPTPAAIIQVLTAEFGFEPRESVSPTEPFAEAVIELNLGQDATLDAALRESELPDDSVSALWTRISALFFGPDQPYQLFGARALECRRGPDFAEPGGLCP